MSEDLEAHEYHRFMTERDRRILALCEKIADNLNYIDELPKGDECLRDAIHNDVHLIKREVSNV